MHRTKSTVTRGCEAQEIFSYPTPSGSDSIYSLSRATEVSLEKLNSLNVYMHILLHILAFVHLLAKGIGSLTYHLESNETYQSTKSSMYVQIEIGVSISHTSSIIGIMQIVNLN